MRTLLQVTKAIFYTMFTEPSPLLAKQRDRYYTISGIPI